MSYKLMSLRKFITIIAFFTLLITLSEGCYATDRKRIVLSDYKPLSEQINYANTIYVVKYSIDLGDKRITMPDNCVLQFRKKGKLRNGTIVGNRTIIEAKKKHVFDRIDIATNGTWNTQEGYPEWFGASSNPENDSKLAIQKAIDVSNTCVLSQIYYTSYNTPTGRGDDKRVCAIAISKKNLKGLPASKLFIDAKFSNTERTSVFWVGDDVVIDGVNIEYLNEDHSGWTGTQAGVYRVQGGNVTIQNTTLKGAMAAWINLQGCLGRDRFVIRNNYVHDCDCGLIIQGVQHQAGDVYSVKLLMENNIIEKEKERHSEFVSFWGKCQGNGKVYYTDIAIKNNKFSGGYRGGCISGHPWYNGLKGVVITDNEFYDCGACSFYNADGLVYERNYVTGSSFVERQVKGVMGSYPDLAFYNCSNSIIDDCSCFGLSIKGCKDLHIGKLRQTLCLQENDTYLTQKDYVTNFIGIKAVNSTVTIEELIVNPFADDSVISEKCKYYIHKVTNSIVSIDRAELHIPLHDSKKVMKIKTLIKKW